jgi:hypothetical protein
MRAYRALLSLICSVVLCMFVWTSDVHALTMTVSDGANSTGSLEFTQITGTAPPGCLSGYLCYGLADWTPTTTTMLTYQTGNETTWLTIDNGAAFTSGPIVSVRDTATSAVFGINGGIFQGFSTTTGTLTITLENNFANLTTGTRPFGMIESGQFLQAGGNVAGDTLSMLGAVDSTNLAAILKTAGTGTTVGYSLNLSPTVGTATTIAGGTDVSYTWTYNYNNGINNTSTPGPLTSRFSDPAGGIGNCTISSQNPGCGGGTGGSAVGLFANDGEYNKLRQTICGTGGCDQTPNSIPEPSSLLLLGLAMVVGGGFVASRLKKNNKGDALEGA